MTRSVRTTVGQGTRGETHEVTMSWKSNALARDDCDERFLADALGCHGGIDTTVKQVKTRSMGGDRSSNKLLPHTRPAGRPGNVTSFDL
jgi:hypothetical protein